MFLIYILIFSFQLYVIFSENLFIPFKTRIDLSKMTTDNAMEMLINNQITVDFLVGSNNQKIELNLKTQNASTYILSADCPENEYAVKYNYNQSTTLVILDQNHRYYMHGFSFATHVNDKASILLKDDKKTDINEFRFMLATKLDYNTMQDVSGVLGLILINDYAVTQDTDFIRQMKQKDITNSEIFMLDYKDQYNGIFYVGDYYHEYNESYTKKDLIKINAGRKNKYPNWEIEVNKIISGNKEIQYNTYMLLFYELGIIGAPIEYYNHTKNTFFKEYLENGVCEEKINRDNAASFQKYSYIVCNKKDFKRESFPELKFFSSENENIYSLSHEYLFYEFNDKIYFLIIHPILSITYEYWYLGKPIFLKYKFFMDKDEKTIGFYNITEEDKKEDGEKKQDEGGDDEGKKGGEKGENNKLVYIIIIAVLVLIIIGISTYFIRRIIKSRKKRANELDDDDMDYTPYKQEKNDIEEGIN